MVIHIVGFNFESIISLKFDGSISNIATLSVGTIKEALKTLKGVKKQTLLTDVTVPFRSQENVAVSMITKKTISKSNPNQ